MTEEDRLMSVAEVAAMFSVKPYTVRAWINDGAIPAVKLHGGRWRVWRSAAIEYANKEYA